MIDGRFEGHSIGPLCFACSRATPQFPFSGSDIRLLDSVATQTSLALANSRLTAAIAAEIAGREKAKRELEIAREVQERLFPQEYPPIARLEYAGACRPALEVGGDYYDFISLSDSELGIAIGDVSGKGIPAALLMATLRAYLRGQAVHTQADLAQVMVNLNKLVYESSASSRYATFFYGQNNSATLVLHYVNGGHNAPMVFRARLGRGHAPGHRRPRDWLDHRVRIRAGARDAPGDVLVAYTDGVSEAMNGDHDAWGEENLMDTVRPNRALPSRELIDRIMAGADAFVAGAPQHDDMTVVVVRLV